MLGKALIFSSLIVLSFSSSAALYDRGNGMIYDDVLDITWLQDANYVATSGYAAANVVGTRGSDGWNIQSDGTMGWFAANEWANGLEYGGYSDWRLPSTRGLNEGNGVGETRSEMGHMAYNNLMIPANQYGGISCAPGCYESSSFVDPSTGITSSFININLMKTIGRTSLFMKGWSTLITIIFLQG